MAELFPVACGLLTGALIGLVRPSLRIPVGMSLAVVLGTAATVISGEFRISWAFLLIDVPLVAVTAAAAFAGVRALRRGGLASR
jgi:hypothetical protein